MKVEAYPLGNGNYALVGNTFYMKDKIKERGGKWNADHKFWVLPTNEARMFAPLMVWVDVDTKCHEGIKPQWVSECQAVPGIQVRTSCSMCDSTGITGIVQKVYRDHVWH